MDQQLKSIYLPLEIVLNIITCSLPKPNVLLAPSHPITQLLLSFTLVCKETQRLANRYLHQHCVYLPSSQSLGSYLLTIPNGSPEARNINAMFLAPFGNTIDDQPTAFWVRELFNYTCTTLRRLIIDVPFRSLYPEDDHLGVRNILRQGFLRLENLEELVCVRDELYLSLNGTNTSVSFWTQFQKLRRLAVYNPLVDPNFWRDVAKMSSLETLVLNRADGLRNSSNIKVEYFAHCDRALKVLVVNVDSNAVLYGAMRRQRWTEVDPRKKMTIMTYTIPLFMDDDPIEVCQDYIRIGAEHATLWDWEGDVVPHPPVFSYPIVQLVSSGG